MNEDYYNILNISKDADENDIKRAYRKLAMKYHPDRNPNDKTSEEKFKKINEAYEVLSDSAKKQAYDTYGHAGVNFNSQEQHTNSNFSDIFSDIFGDIFETSNNKRTKNNWAKRGADLYYNLSLDLEEAVNGVSAKIKINTYITCDDCLGTGSENKEKNNICNNCNGSGQTYIRKGFFSIQQTCNICKGYGNYIKNYCKTCNGQSRIKQDKVLTVKIPAGVDNEDKVRLNKKGESGIYGGEFGDLYIQIHIKEHAIFKRNGKDLHCEIPINFTTAALGGIIEVPSLSGKIQIKIPPETQSKKIFRIKDKGVKSIRGDDSGDLLCKVFIETPVNLNDEQKELLRKLDLSMKNDKNYTPKIDSWLKTVKNFFDNLGLK